MLSNTGHQGLSTIYDGDNIFDRGLHHSDWMANFRPAKKKISLSRNGGKEF